MITEIGLLFLLFALGLLGAGLALSSTRGKDRFWAVPAGGTAGALIGCQVDGG